MNIAHCTLQRVLVVSLFLSVTPFLFRPASPMGKSDFKRRTFSWQRRRNKGKETKNNFKGSKTLAKELKQWQMNENKGKGAVSRPITGQSKSVKVSNNRSISNHGHIIVNLFLAGSALKSLLCHIVCVHFIFNL